MRGNSSVARLAGLGSVPVELVREDKMRTTLAVLSAAAILASLSAAEARGARMKGFWSRSAPTAKARTAGGVVVVPATAGTAATRSISGPLQAADRQSTAAESRDIPTGSIAPASESAAPERAEPRPWCSDGYVVGGGKGFCVVTLKPELRGAPAILPLSN